MRLPTTRLKLENTFDLAGRCVPALLLLLLVAGQLFMHVPFAQDDLLRNVVAYAWDFDYTRMYPMSPGVPPFDPYIGFDWLWGHLAQATSPTAAVHTAQAVGTLAFMAAVLAPLRTTEERVFRCSVVVGIILATLVTSRLVGGRPEVLATAWLLSAAVLRPRTWLCLGAVLSPVYWLMPVYALGGLLLRATWRVRLTSVLVAVGLTGAFWFAYAGLEWSQAVLNLPGMEKARAVAAVEAGPLVELLAYPGTWLLLGVVLVTLVVHNRRLREPEWLVLAAAFLAIGSVRHVLVLAPVLALFVARQAWTTPRLGHWCALTALTLVSGTLAMQQLPSSKEPAFKLPPDSQVLTGYNRNLFLLPFHNPGRVSLTPSIESAWDSPQAVRLAQAVMTRSLTCSMLEETSFDWVISKGELQGSCFELDQNREGWSLWRVARPATAE